MFDDYLLLGRSTGRIFIRGIQKQLFCVCILREGGLRRVRNVLGASYFLKLVRVRLVAPGPRACD